MNLPCGKDTVKCADTCAKTSFIVQKCCSKLRNCAYIRVMPLKGQFYAKQRLREHFIHRVTCQSVGSNW
ncbi:hypothetical protein GDO78_020513 [Eleutherodactylus coqui]|uniref:Uncharacterized protein n=1 Tax=Eleutherodactylus coqui TaxID=57060 RepID=A0A8J6EHS2_ELECQ|nr:hypothetical protein GDO78_020513 [Eleutherodactylus coqui]